jgi:hypothetical protein
MGGTITKEQAISRAQYLDLVYSQSGTLYDLIPNAPRPSNDQTKPTPGPHVDGMIGPVSTDTTGQMTGKHSQSTKATNPSSSVHTNTPSKPSSQTSEVNMVQSTTPKNPQQSEGKNKGNNNKKNKNSSEQSFPKTQENNTEGKRKQKDKYPCMICKEDHFTKDCPHLTEIHQYLERGTSSSTPAVLTNPFPPPATTTCHTNTSTPTRGKPRVPINEYLDG